MIKNILLFIVGSVVGIGVTTGSIYAIYTKTNYKKSSEVSVIPEQNLEIKSEYIAKANTFEKLPEGVVLPELKEYVSISYKTHLQSVISSLNTIINNNNTTILPIMQDLPQRLQTGEWGDIFEKVKQAKVAISESNYLIKVNLDSLLRLEQENSSTTKDAGIKNSTDAFINSSVGFAHSFSNYLASIDALLSGAVPTKEQLAALDTKISDLKSKTDTFKKDGDGLFLIINRAYSATTKK